MVVDLYPAVPFRRAGRGGGAPASMLLETPTPQQQAIFLLFMSHSLQARRMFCAWILEGRTRQLVLSVSAKAGW